MFVFHTCAKAKIWTFFYESISIFLSHSLFSFAFSCLLAVLLPTYHPFFAWNCDWLTFKERGKFNLQRVVGKQRNWKGIFPQNITFFVSVTLTGLVRISKTRYCWKDLSLDKLMFINLYPASRGPLIFQDKFGRLKEHCVTRKKPELKPRTNQVSRN